MSYNLDEAIQILTRTPQILRSTLTGLDENWLTFRKRPDAYTTSEVVGHLIANEQANWIPRMNCILTSKPFPPFDREGFDKTLSLEKRLDLFETLRSKNIHVLKNTVKPTDFDKKSIHPALGEVMLSQLLATWVVHDLTHIFQINENLALRYKEAVGPWVEFLKILRL